ncbi:GIY-YIG nuclease family protein [Acinetobacter bereziniae]|uniref:GIY-YIG nuclease family protein n=1 Tax=Acinetobacter bereziniae TaxID=106648 RepID=UPI002954BFFC|nr:GIY-YIG nuclease family protein [Acinetobacter bereziniae]MDV8154526.1 GIY-YIG nuclease family protein [Acinetobacter bereziniae]
MNAIVKIETPEQAYQVIEQMKEQLEDVKGSLLEMSSMIGDVEKYEGEMFFNFLKSLSAQVKKQDACLLKTYVVQDVDTGIVKIGKSKNVQTRLSAIKNNSGRNLKIIAIFPEDIEKQLHIKYAEFRKVGEWFSLPQFELDDLINETQQSLDLQNKDDD